jgi:hypothetical protein
MFQQFMQSRFAVPAAIALIGLALQFRPQLFALLAWAWSQLPAFPSRSTVASPTAVGVNSNYLDVDALERLDARFARLNCKAGQEAMKQVKQHFFSHQD